LQELQEFWSKPCKFTMRPKTTNASQLSFYSGFEEQLDHQHPLYVLAHRINWHQFEEAFLKHYSDKTGRPAKPIRLMVGLLILKHVRNLSDESVVEQWSENVYYQYFCGERSFATGAPCEASELVHFRNRIGVEGVELILKESIRVNGKDGDEKEVTIDTTVQEKNITFPTDSKLHQKIIAKCQSIANKEEVNLRQSYSRTVKKLRYLLRFHRSKQQQNKARKAAKKIKTIAGRLVRDLERKLTAEQFVPHAALFELFKKVLVQKRSDQHKIYSLHEPHVQCISKGKEHKKYEFGSKVSIVRTRNSGVIVGALNIEKNVYDAHTLQPTLAQYEKLHNKVPAKAIVDLGYRGVKQVGETRIIQPRTPLTKQNAYQKQKRKEDLQRRAAIEPTIGHLKQNYRLGRNFYKGIAGDHINVMLAAAAYNFKRVLNQVLKDGLSFLFDFLRALSAISTPPATLNYSK
jgi:transposase, IS5 family